MGFLWALKNVGGNAVSIPVDDEGMDLNALEAELGRLQSAGVTPKFIYVIPNFQNPSGVSMPLERRKRLIDIATAFETMIFEDDAYHDLRYSVERLPTICSLDRSVPPCTATLSKIMGAGMRIGWLIAAPEIIGRMAGLKIDGSTNVFRSYVAADWMQGQLEAHIDELKHIYAARRDAMLDSLHRHMPEGTTWTRPDRGFFGMGHRAQRHRYDRALATRTGEGHRVPARLDLFCRRHRTRHVAIGILVRHRSPNR